VSAWQPDPTKPAAEGQCEAVLKTRSAIDSGLAGTLIFHGSTPVTEDPT
jgi:hypothetical protein